ncbi:hypothetical protein IU470_27660 [Nocardia abscessus]|uniref:Uncharacterized protein n=1 Tax=Nocardia abscessus TaxID=120957 RepID=A0ABS0CH77_9NOCA|nr:hypothetical protein [Nocardia abscessus]MBF6228857.1 hypothetical protein [Nocardia abscessus]
MATALTLRALERELGHNSHAADAGLTIAAPEDVGRELSEPPLAYSPAATPAMVSWR